MFIVDNIKKNVLVLLLTLATSYSLYAQENASKGYSYSIENKPVWVKEVSIPENNTIVDQGIQYILNNEQLNLTLDNYEHFVSNIQKVVTEGGLEHSSQFSFSFQPDYQSISLHQIILTRNGKDIDITSLADIQLMRRETEISSNIYNGFVDLIALIPDVRIGDTLEFSATIRGKNPVFGKKHFAKFATGWNVPILKNYIRVITDIDRELKFKIHNSSSDIVTKNDGSIIEYVWSENKIEAIIDEQDYPSLYNPYPFIEFSEYKNWGDVVTWAHELYEIKSTDSDELDSYISNLQQSSKTTTEYIEKSIQFVQNDVRYFGIETGINSHKPSLPSTVFSRRFGDCKDKTVLLNYFLSKVGIKAYPALVSTYEGDAIVNHLPSPASFNHVISYFEFKNKPYWIDGTRSYQYGKLDNIGIGNFRKALLIDEKEKKLRDIELNDKHRSLIKVFEKYIANSSYDKPVNMTLEVVMSSHEAEYTRSILANQSLKEFSTNYLNFYGQHFPSIEPIGDLEIIDDKEKNKVTINGKYKINKYWELNKTQFNTDFFGEFISSYIQLPSTIRRTLPLALSHPIEVEHKVSFIFPEAIGWDLDYTPLEIKDNAIEYRRTITQKDKELITTHSYKSKRNMVEVIDIPAHINNLKEIRTALYLSVHHTNKNKSSNIRSVLRSLMNKKKETSN